MYDQKSICLIGAIATKESRKHNRSIRLPFPLSSLLA